MTAQEPRKEDACKKLYSSLFITQGGQREKNSYTVARYSTTRLRYSTTRLRYSATRQAAGNRWEGTRLDTEYLALMLRGKLDCLRLMGKSGKELSCILKHNLF